MTCSISITLFLYGIGAYLVHASIKTFIVLHYSYMELERFHKPFLYSRYKYYIIPIWNWSFRGNLIVPVSILLHYSYMELEPSIIDTESVNELYYYIIPIWNWSAMSYIFLPLYSVLHYSYMDLEQFQCYWVFGYFSNYIIPIWNWSDPIC